MEREIVVDGWYKNLKFSAAHIIPGHNKCGRLHGHTYVVSVYLKGELGNDFMLEDFGILKSNIKSIIAGLDHRVLLPKNNPNLTIVSSSEGPIVKEYEVKTKGGKRYVFPGEDVAVLDVEATTAECLSCYFLEKLKAVYSGVPHIREIGVRVEEGRGQGSWCRAPME